MRCVAPAAGDDRGRQQILEIAHLRAWQALSQSLGRGPPCSVSAVLYTARAPCTEHEADWTVDCGLWTVESWVVVAGGGAWAVYAVMRRGLALYLCRMSYVMVTD